MHDTSVHCRSMWSPSLMAGDAHWFSTTNAMISDYRSKILILIFYLTLALLYSNRLSCPHDGQDYCKNIEANICANIVANTNEILVQTSMHACINKS